MKSQAWRTIREYPGYEISNDGCVRNIISGNVLKPWLNAGYPMVELFSYGQGKRLLVHRLVACAFIGEPKFADLQVNHKEGTRTNNHVDNLEWVTAAQNMQHAHRIGAMRLPSGHNHWNGRKTYCKNGHEFTDDNTYHWSSNGRNLRGCRQCRNKRVYEHRQRMQS